MKHPVWRVTDAILGITNWIQDEIWSQNIQSQGANRDKNGDQLWESLPPAYWTELVTKKL